MTSGTTTTTFSTTPLFNVEDSPINTFDTGLTLDNGQHLEPDFLLAEEWNCLDYDLATEEGQFT